MLWLVSLWQWETWKKKENKFLIAFQNVKKSVVATPLWVKWEDETPTPKVGDLESSGTPECLELDNRGQNTLYWGVLSVIGKFLNYRCLKCPRIGHLDICSPSYGQKKGRESNWQFDSRPLKVKNRPLSDVRIVSATRRWKDLDEGYNFGLDLVADALPSHGVKPTWRFHKVKLRKVETWRHAPGFQL